MSPWNARSATDNTAGVTATVGLGATSSAVKMLPTLPEESQELAAAVPAAVEQYTNRSIAEHVRQDIK